MHSGALAVAYQRAEVVRELLVGGMAATNAPMLRSLWNLVVFLAGLVACSAAGIMASGPMVESNGDPAAAIMLAQSPVRAALAVALFLAVASAIGIGISRAAGRGAAIFAVGFGLACFAGRTGEALELLRLDLSPALLAIELLIWAGLIVTSVQVIQRCDGRDDVVHRGFDLRRVVVALGSGLLALPVVWLIARSPMKGQVLAAAAGASLVAGLIGHLLASDRDDVALYAGPLVAGALGYLLAAILADEPTATTIGNGLGALRLPMPQDYAAGSIIGTSLGIGWAKSFVRPEPCSVAAAASSSEDS